MLASMYALVCLITPGGRQTTIASEGAANGRYNWQALSAATLPGVSDPGERAAYGGHGAINKPVGNGRFARIGKQAGKGGNRSGMHIGWPDEIVCREMVVLRGVLQDVVPDGTGSSNTNDVVHLTVFAIASPDSHREMWCISHRPVIAEA